jgi:diguanylate cyclase (GGDEF)-like protein
VTSESIPVQQQLVDLRTSVVNWQLYIEAHVDLLAPGTRPSTTDLAQGVQLVQAQTTRGASLSAGLRRIGMPLDADTVAANMKALDASIVDLTPIAAGNVVDATTRIRIVAAERVALERVWTTTTALGQSLSRDVTTAHTTDALGHLSWGHTLLLVGVAFDLALVVGSALIFGLRAGRRERARRREAQRQSYEVRLQKALDMTASESAVYDILGASLKDSAPRLNVEMLIAESSHAHFRRACTNAGDFQGCGVVSPVDCPAATGGQALLFPSSDALDACPHLKHRSSKACSAACFPVSIAGRTVGVMHAVGPDRVLPAGADVATLQFTSRRGTDRIAMLRAFATSEAQANTDPLTGLLNRRSLENRVRDLTADGLPYAVGSASIDHFQSLKDTHGHEAGDQAMRLFSRVLRDAVRPNDIAGRSGDEDFLIVLPDASTEVAVGVLERVRERLVLALATGRVPSFTMTCGVASTAYATEFEEIVAIADRALLDARSAGRNRVVVAPLPDVDLRAVELH